MEMFEHPSSRRRVLRIAAALPVVVALPATATAAALADPRPAAAAGRTLECLSDLRAS